MAAVDAGLRAQVEAWIERDPDPATRAELEDLLAVGDAAALADRFAGRLEFGTAGLRGTMAAGPARMNRVVVRQSAAGIARYLLAHVPGAAEAGVAIAHDARHRSDTFAVDCAEVMAQHGIRTVLSMRPLPTPIGVFAVRMPCWAITSAQSTAKVSERWRASWAIATPASAAPGTWASR